MKNRVDYKKSCFGVPIFYLTLKSVHLEKIEVDISLTYILKCPLFGKLVFILFSLQKMKKILI